MSAASAQTGPLQVWLDVKNVELSRQNIVRYKTILSEAFQQPVAFSNVELNNSQIRISNEFEVTGWFDSRYLMDVVPAFSITKRKSETPNEDPLIGIVRRPFQYQTEKKKYLLDDMNTALTLLENKRIDAIIDYAREATFYVYDKPGLFQEEIQEQNGVRVYFKDLQLVRKFESVMKDVVGVRKNSELIIEDVHPLKEAEGAPDNHLVLFQIPKQYDARSNKLVVTETDQEIADWLISQLPEFTVEKRQSNTNGAYEEMLGQDNVCILNTSKSSKRSEIALFSDPTYAYLDYQLYVKKNSQADNLLNNTQLWQGDNKAVDLRTFFKEHEQGLIGYYEYINRTKHFESYFLPMVEEQPQRYMKLTAKDDIKGLRLLESGRIDYLITFPFVLQQHIESMDFIKELHSFSFRFYDQPMPSYIACSQSPEGQGFVSAVNKLMNYSPLRKGLVDIIVKKMIPTDRESLAEAFQQLYSDAD